MVEYKVGIRFFSKRGDVQKIVDDIQTTSGGRDSKRTAKTTAKTNKKTVSALGNLIKSVAALATPVIALASLLTPFIKILELLLFVGFYGLIRVIKELISWAFNLGKDIGEKLTEWIIKLGELLLNVYDQYIKPAWEYLSGVGKRIWDNYIKPGWEFFLNVGKKIYTEFLEPVFTTLKNGFNSAIAFLSSIPIIGKYFGGGDSSSDSGGRSSQPSLPPSVSSLPRARFVENDKAFGIIADLYARGPAELNPVTPSSLIKQNYKSVFN